MSTATATAPANLAAATTARDWIASKVKWLKALTEKILKARPTAFIESLSIGTRNLFGYISSPLTTSIAAIGLASEGGYETVRNAFRWTAKTVIRAGEWFAKVAVHIVGIANTMLLKLLPQKVATQIMAALCKIERTVGRAINFTVNLLNSAVDYIYCALGHTTASRTIRTGALVIGIGTAVQFFTGLFKFTTPAAFLGELWFANMSAAWSGPAMLAAVILSSTGAAFAALGVLAVAGVSVALLLHRDDINDMVATDKVVAETVVLQAEYDTQLEAYEEVINKSRGRSRR